VEKLSVEERGTFLSTFSTPDTVDMLLDTIVNIVNIVDIANIGNIAKTGISGTGTDAPGASSGATHTYASASVASVASSSNPALCTHGIWHNGMDGIRRNCTNLLCFLLRRCADTEILCYTYTTHPRYKTHIKPTYSILKYLFNPIF
jgi:hypothetical protein